MSIILAQVNLAQKSGLEVDAAVNTWWFQTTEIADATDLTNITSKLSDFYISIGTYLAASVSSTTNAHSIKYYNVAPGGPGAGDDSAGSPLATQTFTTATVGTTSLPAEVALCMSFAADVTDVQEQLGSTRPAARRRGRIFLGPLSQAAGSLEATTNIFRPASGFLSQLQSSANALRDGLLALSDPSQWVVYSRKDGIERPVTTMFVDNAFDTQRRRGVAATSRVTLTL